MINSAYELLDKLLSILLLPATVLGALGAFLHSQRRGKPVLQTIIEVIGGAVVANVAMPLAHAYLPQGWHWTAFFLIGWGGLHLVERLYGLFYRGVYLRICQAMGIGPSKEDDNV